jgi:hypothetical protein
MKHSCLLLMTYRFLLIFLTFGCEEDNEINPTNGKTTAEFNPDKVYGSLTDQDGNEYNTIRICNQIWMAENLRTTKFRNGDPIPEVTGGEEWFDLTT